MKGMKWYAGMNDPGMASINQPKDFATWHEALAYLRSEVGQDFLSSVEKVDILMPDRDGKVMGEYVTVSAVLRCADKEQPLAFFYAGQVWWLADLPA